MVVVVVALVVAGAVVLSGVFSGEGVDDPTAVGTTDAASTASASPTPSAEPTPEEELPGVTFGTAENPLAPGESFTMLDDWTITLGTTDLDTWPDLEPYFQETRPDKIDVYQPDPGTVYVSAPANVTYTGDPADQARLTDIVVDYVPADGENGAVNTCGNYGSAVERFEVELDKDLIEGIACTAIPAAQAPGGQWRVFISWFTPEGQETYVDVFYATA